MFFMAQNNRKLIGFPFKTLLLFRYRHKDIIAQNPNIRQPDTLHSKTMRELCVCSEINGKEMTKIISKAFEKSHHCTLESIIITLGVANSNDMSLT